jgi:hypothetical protein
MRQAGKVDLMRDWLLKEDFIDDWLQMTDPSYLGAIDNPEQIMFPLTHRNKEIRSVAGRQFIHRPTGAVFVVCIADESKAGCFVVVIINRGGFVNKT